MVVGRACPGNRFSPAGFLSGLGVLGIPCLGCIPPALRKYHTSILENVTQNSHLCVASKWESPGPSIYIWPAEFAKKKRESRLSHAGPFFSFWTRSWCCWVQLSECVVGGEALLCSDFHLSSDWGLRREIRWHRQMGASKIHPQHWQRSFVTCLRVFNLCQCL